MWKGLRHTQHTAHQEAIKNEYYNMFFSHKTMYFVNILHSRFTNYHSCGALNFVLKIDNNIVEKLHYQEAEVLIVLIATSINCNCQYGSQLLGSSVLNVIVICMFR
jgi:hypothetical protein